MHYSTIPGTELHISLLGFGNFVFGTNWWGEFSDDDGVRLQNQAFDLGVNFFDSAPAYGNGRTERLLAATIDYAGRDNLVIATKFGYDLEADPGEEGGHRERKQNFTPAFLRRELEGSLQRLRTDHIDLWQAHNLKLEHFTDDLFDTLETLQREGKIRRWGIALGPAIGWREEGHKAFLDYDAAIVQTVFNLYEQDPGREFCHIAQKRGRGGVIARVPTNSGILDEEFADANHRFPSNDHRKFRDRDWLVFGLKKNDIIRPMAHELGMSIRQFATKWLVSQPHLVNVEPNLLSFDDVTEFAAACDGTMLPQEILTRLADLYERDFDLGQGAHPCDLKSSTAPGGSVRSGYVQPVST